MKRKIRKEKEKKKQRTEVLSEAAFIQQKNHPTTKWQYSSFICLIIKF